SVHRAGFIHRDIKPDNIYLRDDGSPVLLDFGAARQAIGARTQAITSIVSPGYSPFEQYGKAAGDLGPWTDIYAFGATLYRCVTGTKPPPALDRIGGKDAMIPAAELGRGHYDPTLLSAIDAALSVRAEDRPQDIEAWRGRLRGKPLRNARIAAEPGATLVAGPSEGQAVDMSAALKSGSAHASPRHGEPSGGGSSWLARTLHNAPPARLAVAAGVLFAAIVGLVVALVVILSRAGR
ncbi:MAG: serine/threonine protein kinase, partial [Alphaproteobacteria bacterium]